jgi:exonuclease III
VLYEGNFDCVFVVESWLDPSMSNGLLDPEGKFNVFRFDRSKLNGGGVCVFVNKCYTVNEVNIIRNNEDDDCVEIIGLDIYGNVDKLRVFTVYRPPNNSRVYDVISPSVYMKCVIKYLEQYCNNKGPTIVVGDFNCPDINWSDMSINNYNGVQSELYTFAVTNNYVQCVDEPTRHDSRNILDLVFINVPILLYYLNVGPPFSTSDHNAVNFSIIFDNIVTKVPSSKTRKFMWK